MGARPPGAGAARAQSPQIACGRGSAAGWGHTVVRSGEGLRQKRAQSRVFVSASAEPGSADPASPAGRLFEEASSSPHHRCTRCLLSAAQTETGGGRAHLRPAALHPLLPLPPQRRPRLCRRPHYPQPPAGDALELYAWPALLLCLLPVVNAAAYSHHLEVS